jgi:bifunctional non-homologous end joining protein LigD
MHIQPIIPARRAEPFDDPAWAFELKLDGFRGMADTINCRMISKTGKRLQRFEPLLDSLPSGYVFDGEIVVLDEGGRPTFNDLLFGRHQPVYIAFDLMVADGEDVRGAPLKERRAILANVVRRYRLQRSELVLGEGKAAFKAVCDLDLEGIVAKKLDDQYGPQTKWWKILNRTYSQKAGRAELFERPTTLASKRCPAKERSSSAI